jgi:hypothetical protein
MGELLLLTDPIITFMFCRAKMYAYPFATPCRFCTAGSLVIGIGFVDSFEFGRIVGAILLFISCGL